MVTCADLLKEYTAEWDEATKHPFLDACKAGTIEAKQFNTWLVQDYLFATEFTRCIARVLADAPVRHMDVILGGLGAMKAELLWFKEKASERSLDLSTPPQQTCNEYMDFMTSLKDVPYCVQAVAFWAIEVVYNQAWSGVSPLPEPYTEFGQRWGNKEFTEYVKLLEDQADDVLKAATEEQQVLVKETFKTVAKLEKKFWQMAFDVV